MLEITLNVFNDQIWIAGWFPDIIQPLPISLTSKHTPIGDTIVSLAPDGWEQLGRLCDTNIKKPYSLGPSRNAIVPMTLNNLISSYDNKKMVCKFLKTLEDIKFIVLHFFLCSLTDGSYVLTSGEVWLNYLRCEIIYCVLSRTSHGRKVLVFCRFIPLYLNSVEFGHKSTVEILNNFDQSQSPRIATIIYPSVSQKTNFKSDAGNDNSVLPDVSTEIW